MTSTEPSLPIETAPDDTAPASPQVAGEPSDAPPLASVDAGNTVGVVDAVDAMLTRTGIETPRVVDAEDVVEVTDIVGVVDATDAVDPGTDAVANADIKPEVKPDADAQADAGPRLRKLFPALFGHPAKPLKLQIQHDIQARAPGVFSKKALSAFFRRYTGSHAYLNAVAHAKSRFDLDGQPAGELSAEHRTAAAQELARRRANQQARIELEEQQRRNRATLLRDFQSTTLTPANFCALKGVAVDELDGLLAIAKSEAEERSRQGRGSPPNPQVAPHAIAPANPRANARAGANAQAHDERPSPNRRGPSRPPADARRR